MIDLNTLISNALIAAVQQAVAPLNERIAALESANDILHRVQGERIAALELQRGEMQRTIVTYSERISALEEKANFLEDQAVVTSNRIHDRITALETKLTEAKLFEHTSNATITIDEARMVEALNSQEWFWEKLQNKIYASVEQSMDHHLECYDHDNYDEIASKVDDLPDNLDDYATRDELRSEIEDVLNNATLSLSI